VHQDVAFHIEADTVFLFTKEDIVNANPSFIKIFGNLKDPRMLKKTEHKLIDILVITVCATICRCDESWENVEEFAEIRFDWLKKFLELPNGVPSHDTLRRVFLLLDPVEFQKCFYEWASRFHTKIAGETIAIDGKTVCGSYDRKLERKAIHIVSAWANENRLVLGQIKVDEKSNEITAIPKLLELLDITGCTVTIDAMGTQKDIAKKITDGGANYILGLKGNQGNLYNDAKAYIEDQLDKKITDNSHQTIETTDADHGRIEIRKYHLFTNIDWLTQRSDWSGLNGIGVVESSVEKGNKVSTERRYYITSLKSIDQFSKSVRGHWGVENSLHWVLDVAFDEDRSTRKAGNSPANSTVLKHIVLNLIRQEKTTKGSVNRKRSRACLIPEYLEKIILG
jgi:predicted transposase YbfD/YdcC